MVIITLFFLLDYYIQAICVNRLDQSRTSRFGAMATFISAMVISIIWTHPFVSQLKSLSDLRDSIAEDHVLSGGVVFSFVLFMFGELYIFLNTYFTGLLVYVVLNTSNYIGN
jgi:zinc transporter 5/7